MVDERELVGLLYRADWTALALSGTVRGAHADVPSIITEDAPGHRGWSWSWQAETDPPPPFTPPFRPPSWTDDPELEWTLVIAPGGRYREDSPDERYASGCDGERAWRWFRDLPPQVTVSFGPDDRPQPPFPALLAPSWLLTEYELTVEGEETVQGRTGARVQAVPRRRRGGQRWRRGLLRHDKPDKWPWHPVWDEVDAVIDAELGILLRCSRRVGDRAAQETEFTSLAVGGAVDAERFSPPDGSVSGGRSAFARGFGKETAKTAAGLAAGGLGALVRLRSQSKREDPFARATQEQQDPEAAMPRSEVPADQPGDAALPVNEKILHLLYRSGLDQPRVVATLHEWFQFGALLDAVPRSAREVGFGGVGFLVDSLREVVSQGGHDVGHSVSSLRIGGWDEYRVDVTLAPRSGDLVRGQNRHHPEPQTVACDGQRRWEVYPDRVVSGPADPLGGDLADLLDASWLLAYELTGGEEVVAAGGRRAYKVVVRQSAARPTQVPPGASLFLPPRLMAADEILSGRYFPAVAVVDAESGRLLRLIRYKAGQPVQHQELREVSGLDADSNFLFDPPKDLRVVVKTTWSESDGPRD